MDPELPFVDEHSVLVPRSRDRVWAALEEWVDRSLRRSARSPLPRILGTEPRAGFAVAESAPPERLTLAGRHRFSRYRLVLELAETGADTTELTATTYAAFPGLHGRAYRTLVIGSRAHVLATRTLLRSFRDSVA